VGCSSSSDSTEESAQPMDGGVEAMQDNQNGIVDESPATTTSNPIASLLTDNIQRVGTVSIEEFASITSTGASAEFVELSSAVTGSDIAGAINFVFEDCFVGLTGGSGGVSSIFSLNLPNVTQSFISAGDVLLLTSDEGTYGELVSNNDPDFLSYSVGSVVDFPAPDSLTVDIPGDVFPAFSGIEAQRPSLVTPTDPEIGDTVSAANNVFTWDATGVPGSTISIRAEQVVADPNDFRLVLGCTVLDDGSFTIPASAITRLNNDFGTEDWTMEFQSISSTVRTVAQDGDAVLVVTRTNQ